MENDIETSASVASAVPKPNVGTGTSQQQGPRYQDYSYHPHANEDDNRRCRICYEGGDYGENGCLFRPCKCAGTMAWVHMECLDMWRKSSTNPKSFFKCDQCGYEYKFGRAFGAYDRILLARALSYKSTILFITMCILFFAIFISGFIYKALNIPEPTLNLETFEQLLDIEDEPMHHDIHKRISSNASTVEDTNLRPQVSLNLKSTLNYTGKLNQYKDPHIKNIKLVGEVKTEQTHSFFDIFNYNHYLGGSILFGLGTVLFWLLEVLCVHPVATPRIFLFDTRGGGGGGKDAGSLMLVICVIIGLSIAFYWIFGKVRAVAERASKNMAYIVLDIGHTEKHEKSDQNKANIPSEPVGNLDHVN